MGTLKVNKPGFLTTLQDLGRIGYQEFGMPVAGAMDPFSLQIANKLVGNEPGEGALEITMMGPELEFIGEALIAITGADLSPVINGRQVPMWQSFLVKTGDILTFKGLKKGCRSYVAVAGGFDVPLIMGSKSTYLKGKLGGFEGRALKAGDTLKINSKDEKTKSYKGAFLPEKLRPVYGNNYTIRVILGPQDDYFTDEGIRTFLNSTYKITNEADRMGLRLDGPKIQHKEGADIISDGIALGSVQVPGHGNPIVMMADHQTTGGYTKIATVITPDINLMGQAKPGDSIQFTQVDIDQAHEILKEYYKVLKEGREMPTSTPKNTRPPKTYNLKINGKEYSVVVEEVWD